MAVDIANLTTVVKAASVDSSGNIIGIATAPTRIDPTGTTAQPTVGIRSASTISGTWNSSTPSNTISVGLATTGYSTVTIELIVTGTITAGQISFVGFEANGGDEFILAELGSNASVTQGQANPATFVLLSSLSAGSYYVATINVAGLDTFKFYLNPAIVGSGSVAWYAQASSAVAEPGYKKIWDGTSVATVKAASTPVGTSDTSLVVGLSPNSPLPVLTNSVSTTGLRTPNIFKTAKATATGTTAVWTPTSGKKFRLMRFKLQVTANSIQTTGGVVDFDLQDSTTSLNLIHSVYVPGSALNTIQDYDSGWLDLGNGVLSAAANNVLNLVFTATGFSGAVRVIACGTEE